MGRRREGTVESHGDTLRLRFWLNEKRVTESLGLPDTAPNRKFAARTLAAVQRDIERECLDWSKYFPNSKRAQAELGDTTTRKFGQRWLDTKRAHIDSNTCDQYQDSLNWWYRVRDPEGEIFGGQPLGEVPFQEIKGKLDLHVLVGRIAWASKKMMNNRLTPLRQTCAFASDALNVPNPFSGIRNARIQKGKPDPFTAEERERILAYMRAHYDDRVWAYFNWQFFTGMRPEETIALRRAALHREDNGDRAARVELVRTKGKNKDHTKTHYTRLVELNERALDSLKVMEHYWREDDHGLVFGRPPYVPPRPAVTCGHPSGRTTRAGCALPATSGSAQKRMPRA